MLAADVGDDPDRSKEPQNLPWFTGPLITPSGYSLSYPHYNIEPYLSYTTRYGIYDANRHFVSTDKKRSIQFLLPIQLGIGKNLEFDINLNLIHHSQDGENFTSLGDTGTKLEYQVSDNPTGFPPAGNIAISVIWPTGHYRNFSVHERNVQDTGGGSIQTRLMSTWTRTYQLAQESYFQWRWNFVYSIFSSVHVKGFNSYGGGFGTNGTVYPGNQFDTQIGLQLSLNRNWVLASDFVYKYRSKTKFSGINGTNVYGQEASNALPSSSSWGIAPAIEYNWNTHIGLIGGALFTIAGRNDIAFTSGIIALNIYY